MIRQIQSEAEYAELVRVLRRSFGTVAEAFGLTVDNAPTNPAFMTIEKFQAYVEKHVELLGLFQDRNLIGTVAIEPSRDNDNVYYIERLAVVPEQRHQRHGSILMTYAIDRIRERGGSTASIGIINQNIILKEWYKSQGFKETGCRRFSHLPFEVCFMSKEIIPKQRM